MSRRTSAQAFADAAAAMTSDVHVGDILVKLLTDCAEVLDVAAAAILVTDHRDRLTLLSSSSAAAAELEVLQAQDEQGPCVDAVRTGGIVIARSGQDMERRWGQVGKVIARSGFEMVEAYPMRWRGRVLGGLNIFRDRAAAETSEEGALARAFADVSTIVLLHSVDVGTEQITARVHEAVTARSTIEQAKGVLSELEDLDMEAASRRLQQMAEATSRPLTETARLVVQRAHIKHR